MPKHLKMKIEAPDKFLVLMRKFWEKKPKYGKQ